MRDVVEPAKSKGMHGGDRYDHPAFGQISASRVSGGHGVLYGSDMRHNGYIAIRVHHSVLERDLSQDWHFEKDTIVEVKLSEAQWATFVSSLNMGGGVPCTIDRLHGEMAPGFEPLSEKAKIKKEVGATLAGSATLETLKATLTEAATRLSKSKQAALLAPVERALMALKSNLPFVADQFEELLETKIEAAKAEVHGYMTHALMRAGLDRLGGQPPPQIEHREDDDGVDHQA